jgi:DNA repair protein RadC
MSLTHWLPSDRPRERLRHHGPGALSLRELIALIVGSGASGISSLDVADAVMGAAERSLRRLTTMDTATLEAVAGVGPVTAGRIQAALELGRRVQVASEVEGPVVRGPADVYARMGPLLADAGQEEFHVLLLDTRHRVCRETMVTRGTLDASLIHPREVFRQAILERAAAVVLVHNHPSGDPTPSGEDRAVTRQLADAGKAVGIPVLDHVIVGRGAWTSMSEAGEL